MTYRKLVEELNRLPDAELDNDVSIWLQKSDEVIGIEKIEFSDCDGIIDSQYVLTIDF